MKGRTPLRVLTAPTPQEAMGQAVESFFARCAARGLAEGTTTFYRQRLRRFLAFCQQQAPDAGPADVTASLVRNFLQAERERTSPAGAHHARATLSAFFSHLEREGLIAENPMPKVERVKVAQKLVRPLAEEEIARLLEICGRGFLGARLKALLALLVDTGLRASEACGLDLGDVDLNTSLLRVRKAKGGRERELPFGRAARAALLGYLARRGELPTVALFVSHFGDRLNRSDLHRILKRAGERAGIANVHPHRLRHSAATLFLRGGGNIFSLQRMLGHSSLAMVRRYAEVTQADLVEQHRKVSPGDRFLGAVRGAQGRKRLR